MIAKRLAYGAIKADPNLIIAFGNLHDQPSEMGYKVPEDVFWM